MNMIRTAILAAGLLAALPAEASQCPPLLPLASSPVQVWVLADVGPVKASSGVNEDGSTRTVTEASLSVRQVLKGDIAAKSALVARSAYVENLGAMMFSGHRLEAGRALLGGTIAADGKLEVGGCSGFNGASAKPGLKALLGK